MAKSNSQVTTLDDGTEGSSDTTPVVDPRKVAGTNHDAELCGDKKTITIHSSELEGGHEAVNVGLNGFMYQIPRDTPCEVPMEVVAIIKNARTTSFHAKEGGGHVERNSHRFAFSLD